MENVNEGRSQIKRHYGQYSKIRVNEKAPIRNKVINFVGKRFVTEEEMKSHLTTITEDIGKEFDQRKWFKNNQRYFESFENRGQKVLTLSKYGKRVHEFINKPKDNTLMENKQIGLFKKSLFESVQINEGALAKKGASEFEDYTMQDMIEDAEDKEWANYFQAICTKLGEQPKNVFQVNSEGQGDSDTYDKIYTLLEKKFNGSEPFEPKGFENGMGSMQYYDSKMNVIRADDNGFVGFYFTAKSNF
jgi:hypothetical protein